MSGALGHSIASYMYIYINNSLFQHTWQQYHPKLIFLDIYVYIKRNEVGDPIASYRRKAVVDNTRKISAQTRAGLS